MRIAFFSTILNYPWGGADALWTRAAETSVARGDKIQIVISPLTAAHSRIKAICAQGASLYVNENGSRHHRIRSFVKRIGLQSQNNITRRLRQFSPDRLILSQGASFCGIYDSPLMEYLGDFKGELILLNNAQSEHPYLTTDDRSKVVSLYERAKSIFFVSQRNLLTTERTLLQRLSNASILHYPVFTSEPAFTWPVSSEAKFVSVARYDVYDKGFDLVLPALSELNNHAVPWTFSLFGRGKDECYLREAIRYYGLEERVFLKGFIEDIQNVYEQHHMLLLPSRIEGCALAMTEALLWGRPVLATDVAAAREWIIHNHNGYICPVLSEQSIYESIKNALDHQENWEILGRQALDSAWKQYRPDDYKKLIE